MRLLIATGRQSSRTFAKTVRALLEAMVIDARDEVVITGSLFGSGVRYGNEGAGRESFIGPVLVNQRGWGDCAHLCLWRVAELRNSGIAATFDIVIQERPDSLKRTFHVRVRLPDGSIEDPSIRLGMRVPRNVRLPE